MKAHLDQAIVAGFEFGFNNQDSCSPNHKNFSSLNGRQFLAAAIQGASVITITYKFYNSK